MLQDSIAGILETGLLSESVNEMVPSAFMMPVNTLLSLVVAVKVYVSEKTGFCSSPIPL